jgi:hypothetical protein
MAYLVKPRWFSNNNIIYSSPYFKKRIAVSSIIQHRVVIGQVHFHTPELRDAQAIRVVAMMVNPPR